MNENAKRKGGPPSTFRGRCVKRDVRREKAGNVEDDQKTTGD